MSDKKYKTVRKNKRKAKNISRVHGLVGIGVLNWVSNHKVGKRPRRR